MASIVSLQIGKIAPLGSKSVPSAIVKEPVQGSVEVGRLGLKGDQQADLRVHGGRDKAVYFYPSEHYPRWAQDVPQHAELLRPGSFGENITTDGLDEHTLAIGDVLQLGTARMQITEPRQPCFKLGLRFADNSLGKIMMTTDRTGWYARVLEPGQINTGDEIHIVERSNSRWTVARFSRLVATQSTATVDELTELLTLEGLPPQWKEAIAERLRNDSED
jgi:MOSC domain-containing protein YiiM